MLYCCFKFYTGDYKLSGVRKAPKIASRTTENAAGCGRKVAETFT
jgi:hypothetical protein